MISGSSTARLKTLTFGFLQLFGPLVHRTWSSFGFLEGVSTMGHVLS